MIQENLNLRNPNLSFLNQTMQCVIRLSFDLRKTSFMDGPLGIDKMKPWEAKKGPC